MTIESSELDVVIVGAGLGGINIAAQLFQTRPDLNILVIEKSNDIAGVWRANAYPGLHCDVPWLTYAYSWDLKEASKVFGTISSPPGPLLKKYFQGVHDRFPFPLKCGTAVLNATWKSDRGVWELNCDDGSVLVTRYLVCATGTLSVPRIPKDLVIEKQSSDCHVVHTAKWDLSAEEVKKKKRIAVIGNGSSSTQTFAALALREDQPNVDWYWSSHKWILKSHEAPPSAFFLKLGQRFPWLLRLVRRKEINRFDFLNWLVTSFPKLARFIIVNSLPKLSFPKDGPDGLIPDFPVGCSRLVISTKMFDALELPTVKRIHGSVTKISSDGKISTKQGHDNEDVSYDLIVLGTGFDVGGCLPRFEVYGKGGMALKQHWSDMPSTLLGLCTDGFPNLFFLGGPNANPFIGTACEYAEHGTNFILRCLKMVDKEEEKLGGKGGRRFCIEVSSATVEKHMEWLIARLKEHPSSNNQCSSWYRQSGKYSDVIWPGGMDFYGKLTRSTKKSDFEIY
ncbi:hypothetical protein MP638_005833 [Amoeboaphelidium occidentale]|nr:hypothetical protein MP638_005833 [Amoeboaphelidium occidentale]